MILILVNHDFISDVEGFSNTPLKDVRLELHLPPWGHHEAALAADGNRIGELELSTNGDSHTKSRLSFKIENGRTDCDWGAPESVRELGRRFRELQDLARQRTERQLSAELEAEREKLKPQTLAILRERGILLESGCEIGDGRDLADWREEGTWPRISHPEGEEKRSGNYSLRVTERKQYSLPVAIPGGIRCRLKFYVKFLKIDINEKIQAAIEYLDEKGNIVDVASIIETASSSGWKFATCESVAPPGASHAQVRFHKEGATGSAWVDDVRLVNVSRQAASVSIFRLTAYDLIKMIISDTIKFPLTSVT